MIEYRKCTIGDLIADGSLLVHKDGNYGSSYPRIEDFGITGHPFLTAKSLSDWRVDFDGAPRLSKEKASTLKFGFLKAGDVLLSHNATVGRVAIVPDTEEIGVIGTSLTQFRVNARQLSPKFLALYFSSKPFQDQLSFVMSQTTRNQVPITEQRKLPIILPPLPEQIAIAEVIFSLIDKIDTNRRMNETLEMMARALFKDWFVDFGPTRAKMEGHEAYLASHIWSLFPDRLDGQGRPDGWSEAPLTHFFEIVGGGTPKTSEQTYWDGEIPWFSVVDTPAGSDIFVFETEKHISELGLKNSSARLLHAGETVISARGTVGNLAIAGGSIAFNQSCYGLKAINGYGSCFVFFSAKHLVTKLQSLAHGSVFSTITRQTFESVHLTAPGVRLAKQFEIAASAFLDKIRANVSEAHTLAATRDLLLPKLMSGEVRVRDAQRMIG